MKYADKSLEQFLNSNCSGGRDLADACVEMSLKTAFFRRTEDSVMLEICKISNLKRFRQSGFMAAGRLTVSAGMPCSGYKKLRHIVQALKACADIIYN